MSRHTVILLSVAAALLAANGPRAASAEPVLDRVFSEADAVTSKSCAIVRIGFNFRVRYIGHFPTSNGDEVRIDFKAIDPEVARAEILTRRESLRVPAAVSDRIRAIEFEIGKGTGLSVLVSFRDAIGFDVAQGGDFESLVLALQTGKGAKACAPDFPQSAVGTGKWDADLAAEAPAGEAEDDVASGSDAKLLAQAQKAMSAKDYGKAIRLTTKILSHGESDVTEDAKELLGLARERNGQLAHARAEYEEYLARYPDGEGAARVRKRLASLEGKAVEAEGSAQAEGDPAGEGEPWRVSGSLSQFYIRDEGIRKLKDPTLPPDPNEDEDDKETFQNELLSGLDVNAEWRTGAVRNKARFSGTLEDGFEEGDGDIGSIASAYLDSAVPGWGVSTKVGRQSRNTGGVIGRFDGGLASYQATDQVRLNVVSGSPVEHRSDLPYANDSIFYGLSADIGPVLDGFDTTVYAIEQQTDGLLDRQAVGTELRYTDDTTSVFGLLDYDVHYNEVNMAITTASWTAPDKSTVTASADYRKSPFLLTQNALQGQAAGSLADMLTYLSEEEIDQLALDRSATARTFSVSYAKPLNDMFQVTLDATLANISASPASGGVEVVPATGNDYYYSALLLANSVLRENDAFTLGLRYADRQSSNTYAVDVSSRYPVTSALRVSPTLRLSYREGETTDFTEWSVLPSVRLNYAWMDDVGLELEAGAKYTERQEGTTTSEDLEYFFLVGYHYDFDVDERSFGKLRAD